MNPSRFLRVHLRSSAVSNRCAKSLWPLAMACLILSRPVAAQPSGGGASATMPAPASAPEPATSKPGKDDRKNEPKPDSVTAHAITLNGERLGYTATAGTVTLKEEDGKEKANIFFIAYAKEGVSDTSSRPITFCFNGGPGSSSV